LRNIDFLANFENYLRSGHCLISAIGKNIPFLTKKIKGFLQLGGFRGAVVPFRAISPKERKSEFEKINIIKEDITR
jgi:hypothetical protein